MKKRIIALFIIIILLSSITLTGCKSEEEKYEDSILEAIEEVGEIMNDINDDPDASLEEFKDSLDDIEDSVKKGFEIDVPDSRSDLGDRYLKAAENVILGTVSMKFAIDEGSKMLLNEGAKFLNDGLGAMEDIKDDLTD